MESTAQDRRTGLLAIVFAFILAMFLVPGVAHAESDYTATGLHLDKQSALQTQDLQIQANLDQFGVDVSSWQGTINWNAASRNIRFAIIRCGYGSNWTSQDDSQWLNNVRGCQSNNIPFGVYLYSYATNTAMAQSEAQHVIRCLNNAGLNPSLVSFPIYLDIEDEDQYDLSPATFAAIFSTFKSTLNAAGYGKVGIYSSASWWEGRLASIPLESEYRWVAHWGVSQPAVGFPKTYAAGCDVWQYTSDAHVSGISGRVDGNYCLSNSTFLQGSQYSNMFRLYNPNSGEHLYTKSASERDRCSAVGWNYEGVAFRVPNTSSIPMYRLYNPNSGDHHYTTNATERDWLKGFGWVYEGVAWHGAPTGADVYRMYNPNLQVGTHHYTMSAAERDWLKGLGWIYEGVAMKCQG